MEEQLQKRVSNQKNLAYKVQEIAAMQEKMVIWFKLRETERILS